MSRDWRSITMKSLVMKTRISFILLVFCPFAFCQMREELRGRVLTDAPTLENVIIFNTTSKSGTVTDADGFFRIKSMVGDTLVFSGLAVKSKKIAIKKKDAEVAYIDVKLESFINELEAVDVASSKIRNPAGKKGSQGIVDQKYYDDKQSSPKNPLIYDGYGSFPNGTNFVRLYKDIVKLVKRNRSKKGETASVIDFSELAIGKFNYDFFIKNLELQQGQITLFLVFCESDPKVKTFTTTTTKFEIMDFLITKNTEFKKIIESEE